jgi:glycosyltransferase involved in cell wall biosynthesis
VNKLNVCALIPAYNSQCTIAEVVRRARPHVAQVVVVDDGSQDQTLRQARQAGAHLLGSSVNQGKGRALAQGFAYALRCGFEAVVTLDADLQHDADDIPRFMRRYLESGAHLIIGDRMHARSAIPGVRRIPNAIGMQCFSWLTGQTIRDSQCGFRLYRRELLAAVPVITAGFDTESDLLLRAGRRGMTIDFIPIAAVYFNSGGPGSFYRPIRDTYYICTNFLKNWLWRQR